jgi:hypothetical protein
MAELGAFWQLGPGRDGRRLLEWGCWSALSAAVLAAVAPSVLRSADSGRSAAVVEVSESGWHWLPAVLLAPPPPPPSGTEVARGSLAALGGFLGRGAGAGSTPETEAAHLARSWLGLQLLRGHMAYSR